MRLTEAGQAFYRHCAALRREIEDAQGAVNQFQSAPRGTLRVGSQFTIGSQYLAPLLADFLHQYPEIHVQLELRDRAIDLLAEDIDVALHTGPLDQVGYRHRALGHGVMHLYASPDYLARCGEPRHPRELTEHITLAQHPEPGMEPVVWTLRQNNHSHEHVALYPALVANEALSAVNTAVAGNGIFLATGLLVRPHLKSGALVPVLPMWSGPRLDFSAVFPSRRELSPKVRVFIDYLIAHLRGRLRER